MIFNTLLQTTDISQFDKLVEIIELVVIICDFQISIANEKEQMAWISFCTGLYERRSNYAKYCIKKKEYRKGIARNASGSNSGNNQPRKR